MRYLFLLLFLWAYNGTAQVPIIDTLHSKLQNDSPHEKIATLSKLSVNLSGINIDSSEYYARLSMKLADSLSDDVGKVKAYMALSQAYLLKDDLKKARFYSQQTIEFGNKLGLLEEEAWGRIILAGLYSRQGQYDSSFNAYISVLQAVEGSSLIELQVSSLLSLGRVKELVNDLPSATEFLNRAFEIARKHDMKFRLAQISVNLAVIAYKQNNIALSIKHNQKALELALFLGERKMTAKCYNNLGFAHNIIGKQQEALNFYQKSYLINKELGNKRGISQNLTNQSKIYLQNANYTIALAKAEEGLQLARLADSKSHVESALKILYEISEEQKDYSSALRFFKKLSSLKDSLYQVEKEKAIEEMALTYENEKLQKENEIQRQTNFVKDLELKQRNYLITVVFLTLIIGTVFFFQRRSSYRHQLADSKLRLLKSQFKPHFIFNLLNSIQNLILKEDTEKAYQHLGEFASLMRRDLNAYEQELISLKLDIDLLKDYVKLEKLRFKDKIDFKLNIDSKINLNTESTPPMLIQPLVENAFFHAFTGEVTYGLIEVSYSLVSKDFLQIIIRDNGVGFSLKDTDNGSKGIDLVKERLKLSSPKNKIEFKKINNNKGSGTEITLRLKRK